MDQRELKKIRNREAATGGLVMGLALYLIIIVDYLTNLSLTAGYVVSLGNMAVICFILYYFTRRYGKVLGEDNGMTYSVSYGFILLTMAFAGVIYGLFYFLQTNIIDPEYYTNLQNQIILQNSALTDEQKDIAINSIAQAMSNPLIVIVSSIISTILSGAFLGLIVSVFTKRRAVEVAYDEEKKEEEKTEDKE